MHAVILLCGYTAQFRKVKEFTMLEIWLEEIVLDVIATLMSTALIGTWAFRGKIWPKLASLYMLTSEAVNVPIALCIKILQNLARLTNDITGSRFSAVFQFQVSISRRASEEGSVGVPTAPNRSHIKDQ